MAEEAVAEAHLQRVVPQLLIGDIVAGQSPELLSAAQLHCVRELNAYPVGGARPRAQPPPPAAVVMPPPPPRPPSRAAAPIDDDIEDADAC